MTSPWDTLRGDPVFRLALLFSAVVSLIVLLPILSEGQLSYLLDFFIDPATICLGILAFQVGLRRIASARERRFWNLMTVAYVFWFLVEPIYMLSADAARTGLVGISVDFSYLMYYLLIILAIVSAPHLKPGSSLVHLRRRAESLGTVVFGFGLLFYFAVIPQRFGEGIYETWTPLYMMFLLLDGYIFVRFALLSQACESRRWSAIYTWMAVGSFLWCASDLLEYWTQVEVIPTLPWGTPADLIWVVPVLPIVVAARLRHHPFPESQEATLGEASRDPWQLANPIVLFALAFPLLHLGFNILGLLDLPSRRAREVCVLVVLLVLGGLASLHHRLLGKERRSAMAALRETEERLRSVVMGLPVVLWAIDSDGIFTFSEGKALEALGLKPGEAVGQSVFELYREAPQVLAAIKRVLEGAAFDSRVQVGELVFETHYTPILDEDGKTLGATGVSVDVTDRANLEEQLRQSQKMEAVGRLAGGVAHDFNNLLTVVNGYAELLQNRLHTDDPNSIDVEHIRKAGERAVALTRQLLAFSRRQMLQPRVLDLNEVVSEMGNLLRRLIGENIELITIPDPELGRVRADPGQIEQVIVNLSVNARDAMPQGGRLIVETSNAELDETYARSHVGVQAGSYVVLSVSDTGFGMDEETASQVFEPFFTTKKNGEGTGLGLSTVYGIVKQSGGDVWVYSEPQKGTSFKIYLPRLDEMEDTASCNRVATETVGGSESVLLVEDEGEVRGLARKILEMNGYKVLEAKNGDEALALAQSSEQPIDLLVTDVVMPGLNGRELAERLSSLRGHIRVLFLSGYTDDALVRGGMLDESLPFLEKPFSALSLVRKVREVLDA